MDVSPVLLCSRPVIFFTVMTYCSVNTDQNLVLLLALPSKKHCEHFNTETSENPHSNSYFPSNFCRFQYLKAHKMLKLNQAVVLILHQTL